MKKFTITILLTLLSISLVTAQTKPDVAVLGADPNNLSDPRSKLQSTGLFNTVDAINVSSTTPSLSNLQQYDAVLVYYSDFPADRNALGDVLADYVDSGGGVVIAEFALAASPFTLGGKWASKNYYAIQPTGVLTGRQTLGQVLDPNHPIMQDVTNLDGGSSSFRPPAGSLHPDAVEIARWSDGSPLVVTREIDISSSNGLNKKGARNTVIRVDLGLFPVSADGDKTSWDPTEDFPELMAKSLFHTMPSLNSPPELAGIPDTTMNEGETLIIPVSASDPDGDNITLTVNNLPPFASFTPEGGGKGTIAFGPGPGDAAVYAGIEVIATDDGNPQLSDTVTFTLTVNNSNRPPKIKAVDDFSIPVGTPSNEIISASDPDGDAISLHIIKPPPFFTSLTDLGNGIWVLNLAPPDSADVGTHEVEVVATDEHGLSDTTKFTITVLEPNGPPVAMQDTYGTIGNVGISADADTGVLENDSDPDGDFIEVTDFQSQSAKGGKVTMTEDGGFNYEPPPGFTGFDDFFYTVSDDQGSTSTLVTIEVKEPSIWFVNNTAAGENKGTFNDPFQSMPDLNANQGSEAPNSKPGDIFYVYTGSQPYPDGIALQDDQTVFGDSLVKELEERGITISSETALFQNPPPVGGNRPVIGGINLAKRNRISDLDVAGQNRAGISGEDFETVEIDGMKITVEDGPFCDLTGGELKGNFDHVSSTDSPGAGGNFSDVSGEVQIRRMEISNTLAGLTYSSSDPGPEPLSLKVEEAVITDIDGVGIFFDGFEKGDNVRWDAEIKKNSSGAAHSANRLQSGNSITTAKIRISNTAGPAIKINGGGEHRFGDISITNSGGPAVEVNSENAKVVFKHLEVTGAPQAVSWTGSGSIMVGDDDIASNFDQISGAGLTIFLGNNQNENQSPSSLAKQNFTAEGDTAIIENVRISDSGLAPILVEIGGTDSSAVIITNNTVSTSSDSGISVLTQDSSLARVTLTGNDASAGSHDFLLLQQGQSNFQLEGFAGGDSAAVAAFIQNNNVGTPSVTVSGSISPGRITSVDDPIHPAIPNEYTLAQNYPNPFNPTTTIQFALPTGSQVVLKIYNLLGREVATLVNEELQSGKYKVDFEANGLPSGVYFYQIRAGGFSKTKKLTLLK